MNGWSIWGMVAAGIAVLGFLTLLGLTAPDFVRYMKMVSMS